MTKAKNKGGKGKKKDAISKQPDDKLKGVSKKKKGPGGNHNGTREQSSNQKKKGGGKKQQKVWGSKQVLASPFAPTIPPAHHHTRESVHKVLLDIFPKPFALRNPRPSRNAMEVDSENENPPSPPKNNAKQRKRLCKKPPGILCGVNEVTRALEKKKLSLVLLSRDVSPQIMILHIPPLCYTTATKLVIMPGDGTDIGNILGTGKLLALGIRTVVDTEDKQNPEVADESIASKLLEMLSPLQTKLDYPWLASACGASLPSFPNPLVIAHRKKKDIP